MNWALRILAMFSLVLAMGAFAFGGMILDRSVSERAILASKYRDLPKLQEISGQFERERGTEKDNEFMRKSAERHVQDCLNDIAVLQSSGKPSVWPWYLGFGFGMLALALMAFPNRHAGPSVLKAGDCVVSPEP